MIIQSSQLKILTGIFLMLFAGSIIVKAQDNAADYQVMPSTDSKIRKGVRAYKKDEFEKAAMFMRSSLKGELSKSKQAVVQSNLCVIYEEMGDNDRAKNACDKAFELRPGLFTCPRP